MLYDSTTNPNVKIWEMSIYDKIIIKKMLIIYNSAYSTNCCVIEYWKEKQHIKGNVLQYKILICVTVRLYFHMWEFASLTLIMHNHKHTLVLSKSAELCVFVTPFVKCPSRICVPVQAAQILLLQSLVTHTVDPAWPLQPWKPTSCHSLDYVDTLLQSL